MLVVSWTVASVLSLLSITFPAIMPLAFAQEGSDSVNQQVASLLGKVESIQTKLDEFGNPDRFFAPNATESIRKLGEQLSSIEQECREIAGAQAVTELTDTQKKEFQNQLESLRAKISVLQMRVKVFLQHAPLLQSLKSQIENSTQNREQEKGIGIIFTIVLCIVLFGIVGLLLLAFLELRKLAMLLQQTLPKLAKLEDVPFRLNLLTDVTKSGLENLGQIARKQQTPAQQEPQTPKIQHDLTSTTRESPLQTFCRLYNAAVEDSNERGKFMQRYKPVRFGVTNVMDRYHSLNIAPVFQTANDGDYYAVAIEGDKHHAVVPRFDLTVQESSYGPGAMGRVFECPNYNPQQRYRGVKVVKPAFFEPDSAKQRWTLKETGKLNLGQGE